MYLEILSFVDNLFVAAFLILVTCVVHAIGLDAIMTVIDPKIHMAQGNSLVKHVYKILITIFSIMGIFFLITIHIWIWALMYRFLDVVELKNLEDAVYFSTVTFSTLGYGDIVLKDHWKVLSGIEAVNGIVILGWSTALVFEIMTMLYPRGRR